MQSTANEDSYRGATPGIKGHWRQGNKRKIGKKLVPVRKGMQLEGKVENEPMDKHLEQYWTPPST